MILIKRFAILIFLIPFFLCSISFAEDEVGTQTQAEAQIECMVNQLIDQNLQLKADLDAIKTALGISTDSSISVVLSQIDSLKLERDGWRIEHDAVSLELNRTNEKIYEIGTDLTGEAISVDELKEAAKISVYLPRFGGVKNFCQASGFDGSYSLELGTRWYMLGWTGSENGVIDTGIVPYVAYTFPGGSYKIVKNDLVPAKNGFWFKAEVPVTFSIYPESSAPPGAPQKRKKLIVDAPASF